MMPLAGVSSIYLIPWGSYPHTTNSEATIGIFSFYEHFPVYFDHPVTTHSLMAQKTRLSARHNIWNKIYSGNFSSRVLSQLRIRSSYGHAVQNTRCFWTATSTDQSVFWSFCRGGWWLQFESRFLRRYRTSLDIDLLKTQTAVDLTVKCTRLPQCIWGICKALSQDLSHENFQPQLHSRCLWDREKEVNFGSMTSAITKAVEMIVERSSTNKTNSADHTEEVWRKMMKLRMC